MFRLTSYRIAQSVAVIESRGGHWAYIDGDNVGDGPATEINTALVGEFGKLSAIF